MLIMDYDVCLHGTLTRVWFKILSFDYNNVIVFHFHHPLSAEDFRFMKDRAFSLATYHATTK